MGCGASTQDEAPPVPEVEVIDEEDELAEDVPVERAKIPDYWVNKNIGDGTQGFDQLIYVDREHFPLFDHILAKTYVPRVTQDRPCPTGEHDRSRGGCPCVQPGATPGLPTKYRTRQVIRVEDSGMWSRYLDKVQGIKDARRGEKFHLFKPPVMSNQITTKNGNLFAPLEKNLNEVYLFHGTRVRYALSIAQDDFRIDLAGSSRGTMYGPGAYLAESSTKADEYAMDEEGGYYEGVYALLLCRVCMGKMFYTQKRCEEAVERVQDGSHDSTLGDRARSAKTFRELVVYDADQLYPEYIIMYQRVHAGDDESEVEQQVAMPFHMQLPLYWTNVHKDPDGEDGFDNQYVVRSATKDVFQQLMEASVPEGGLTVSRVRRVENSGVWSRFVKCKGIFREKLDDPNGRFDNQLEVEKTPKQLLADILSGGDAEQLMSLGDIDERINEYLLWFGAPKDSIEWMARGIEMCSKISDDWSISEARFSCGLLQSLRNAEPDENGVRSVVLCRVALGDATVSEDPDSDIVCTADSVIFKSTKHNTSDQAIVCEENQVYAEYIFEITGGDDLVGVEEDAIVSENSQIVPENSADFLLPLPGTDTE